MIAVKFSDRTATDKGETSDMVQVLWLLHANSTWFRKRYLRTSDAYRFAGMTISLNIALEESMCLFPVFCSQLHIGDNISHTLIFQQRRPGATVFSQPEFPKHGNFFQFGKRLSSTWKNPYFSLFNSCFLPQAWTTLGLCCVVLSSNGCAGPGESGGCSFQANKVGRCGSLQQQSLLLGAACCLPFVSPLFVPIGLVPLWSV